MCQCLPTPEPVEVFVVDTVSSSVICVNVCRHQSLLEDPSHVVRSLLAFGLCKICAVYWEYIPSEVVKTLLTSLAQKHAWDSSNTEVRLSVIKVSFFSFLLCLFLLLLLSSCKHYTWHSVSLIISLITLSKVRFPLSELTARVDG